MPIVVVLSAWLSPDEQLWGHFWRTLLPRVMSSSFLLLLGVGIGSVLLGTLLAWLVVMVDFPGRRFFDLALFFPLVVPAYVLAFVYLGFFDYAGYLQVFLREFIGLPGFDIRGHGLTVVIVFVLVFYPYVYTLARSAFKKQQGQVIETARLAGLNIGAIFWRISLPLARPAIIAGLALTLMETLADFGVVSLFNYDTFTTAIYSAWYDYRSVETAAQFASVLILIAFVLTQLERHSRGASRYDADDRLQQQCPYKLSGLAGYGIAFFMAIILALAFILPVIQLLIWAWREPADYSTLYQLVGNSLMLMFIAVFFILFFALLLALSQHLYGGKKWLATLATMGYALPGSVMAIGILYGVNYLSNVSIFFGGSSLNAWLFSSIALLILAYISRFMALAYNPIDAGLQQIKPIFGEAASLLGADRLRLTRQIYLPMIKTNMLGAALLVLIDVMKELPATYLLRPFGWDTLAIKTYELSSEGLYQAAALPALAMVVIAALVMYWFKRIERPL